VVALVGRELTAPAASVERAVKNLIQEGII